jgi:invasion protein IalB
MVGRKSIPLALVGLLLAAPLAMAQTPDVMQETYRDWVVRCQIVPAADGVSPTRLCEMAQELSQPETGQRVLTVALQSGPDEQAGLTLITPFGLRLSAGVAIDIDAVRLIQIAFRTCLPQGCVATEVLDKELIDRLTAGTIATAMITSDEGGPPIAIEVSLNGFAAAWTRLVQLADA